MVDVFPNPRGNLELGGLVGIARVSTGPDDDETNGFAAGIWGGYGFWAGDQLSLVGLLRLGYALTQTEITTLQTSASGANTIDRSDSSHEEPGGSVLMNDALGAPRRRGLCCRPRAGRLRPARGRR